MAFACILLGSVGRNTILLRQLPNDLPARNAVTRTLVNGVIVFIAAFAIWNIDNICCRSLRQARDMMSPWGFLLEGHAYWHFGTGYGAYLIITAVLCQ